MTTLKPSVLVLLHLAVYGGLLAVFAPGSGIWALVLAGLLIWISVIDTQRFEIPDTASALLAISGLWRLSLGSGPDPADALLGATFWPLAFWGVGRLYLQARGMHGLGFGDVKLMVGIGLWCGLLGTIWVVLGAALSGAALMLATTLGRPGPLTTRAVAFGPFLCLCAWYVWVTGMTT